MPPSVRDAVLTSSRRRCCICFGLFRDTGLKQGQIAHLDQNPRNHDSDNLAFLCLNHHDQYDGSTSQSKGLTSGEVKAYRVELLAALSVVLSEPVRFGRDVVGFMVRDVSGHYVRQGETDSAELHIMRLPNGDYHVTGLALWGTTREFGPNIGELDFVSPLEDDKLTFTSSIGTATHRVTIGLTPEGLIVSEENWIGVHGINVCFDGIYGPAAKQTHKAIRNR